jgi:hypothetical protein
MTDETQSDTSAAPRERYRSPGRRGDARQPRRVLASARFNRKLWQSLRAEAASMTPAERVRVGLPAELPPEAEPDRTPARHGAWLTPRERRQLTNDLRRARMEDSAKLSKESSHVTEEESRAL